MKALTIHDPSAPPQLTQRPQPCAAGDLALVKVAAAALTNLDVAVAEGRHYFSPDVWPRVTGREGVAVTAAGERVFLTATAISAPHGSHAEWTVADLQRALPVPPTLSDELAAAIGNPGLAAWLAVAWRGRLARGETVLVLGATGACGRIAVAAAALLGAGRVVAAGRSRAVLERLLQEGADAIVPLDASDDFGQAFKDAAGGGIDLVIDLLNGPPAEAAISAMRLNGRLVQVGSLLAPATRIDAQQVRRHSLDVLGFAYYHAPIEDQIEAFRRLGEAACAGRLPIDYAVVSLGRAAEAWAAHKAGSGVRHVFRPDGPSAASDVVDGSVDASSQPNTFPMETRLAKS